jgi:Holliday junction resolvase RusA-like endonuclease
MDLQCAVPGTVVVRVSVQGFVMAGWLPAPLTNGSRGHWSTYQRKLKAAQLRTWVVAKEAGITPLAGRAKVTITLTFPVQRRRDTDNLYARCKGVVDGLVKGGWLTDDDTEHLELVVRGVVCSGYTSTMIELEDVA